MLQSENFDSQENSEEVFEIITMVPSWILRWGTTLVFGILVAILFLSAVIQYPDILRTTLKVNSVNSPRTVIARDNGKINLLLVNNGESVEKNQVLAYLESTASPNDVFLLRSRLKEVQGMIGKNSNDVPQLPEILNLGEMQANYQNFYQQYLQYKSTKKDGYYHGKLALLESELKGISVLRNQIGEQDKVHRQEFANLEKEFFAYQKLYEKKVISRSEFMAQENKYFAAKYPIQQSNISLISNAENRSAKLKELLDLRHTIADERSKFTQSLNQCIAEIESWIQRYILIAPISGKVTYAGLIEQNQNIAINQEIFIVNPENSIFFGEIKIPQYNMGKIKLNDRALVKLRSYPFEQFGALEGKLSYISDVAYRDSVFIAKVNFEKSHDRPSQNIVLKNGMLADVEIIVEESSLLKRFFRNLLKVIDGAG